MEPPNLDQIANTLQGRRAELAQEYGVSEIGVFGSCVRGEAAEGSDVDILVGFDRPIGLLKFVELEELLAECLGTKVDLVTRAALKPHIGRYILDEVVML